MHAAEPNNLPATYLYYSEQRESRLDFRLKLPHNFNELICFHKILKESHLPLYPDFMTQEPIHNDGVWWASAC
jgi:hypothetical protein